MTNSRDELEAQPKSELIERAIALGISSAPTLTHSELIDEILSATIEDERERDDARGLYGRARDLVAKVVEKKLHLAAPLSSANAPTSPTSPTSPTAPPGSPESDRSPSPIATVALAGVYASQGHVQQALEVLNEVLRADPQNKAAMEKMCLLTRNSPDSQPRLPTKDELSQQSTDSIIICSWKLRPVTLARFRARIPTGHLAIRLCHSTITNHSVRMVFTDCHIDRLVGSIETSVPPSTVRSHAALGWLDGGVFSVIATPPDPPNHSPARS